MPRTFMLRQPSPSQATPTGHIVVEIATSPTELPQLAVRADLRDVATFRDPLHNVQIAAGLSYPY